MIANNQIDCQATTAKGTPCTRFAVEDGSFCKQHTGQVERAPEEPAPAVCASCIDAFAEEFAGFFDEHADRELACTDYGADMPDHFCERLESTDGCACACGDLQTVVEPPDPCVDCGNPETSVGAPGFRRCEPCYEAYKADASTYSQPGDVYATDNPLYQFPEQCGHSDLCQKAKPVCATCGERICALGCPRFATDEDIRHAYGRCLPERVEPVTVAVAPRVEPVADLDLPTDWDSWKPGRKAAWTRKNRPGQTSRKTRSADVDPEYYRAQPVNWDAMTAGQKAAWTRKHRQLVGA